MTGIENIEKYLNQHTSRAFIVWGNFELYQDMFLKSLKSFGFDVLKPGHYFFTHQTFDIDEARNLLAFYESKVSSPDSHTIIVIAAQVFKDNASQLLLKFIEELDEKYKLFICLPYGTFVLPTITSRVQEIYVNTNVTLETYIQDFFTQTPEERIETVSNTTKKMESFEIREYTQKLLNSAIVYLYNQENKKYSILENLLSMQKNLITGTVAPKFVLDFICVSV